MDVESHININFKFVAMVNNILGKLICHTKKYLKKNIIRECYVQRLTLQLTESPEFAANICFISSPLFWVFQNDDDPESTRKNLRSH